MRRPLANALDIDLAGGLTDQVTPHAGSALLIEPGRRSGVIGAAERHLPATQSAKRLRQGELVEAFVVLSALGGECLDDVEQLRRDRGLAARLGYDLPAASTARHRLDQLHDPVAVSGRPQPGSLSPAERAGLAGLRAVVEHSVRTSCAAVPPGPMVTLDVDDHLVEASKQSALRTYEGCRGYQPLLVSWAETGPVVADEVRDGNVPASPRIKELVDQAAAALPQRSADDPLSSPSSAGSTATPARSASARPPARSTRSSVPVADASASLRGPARDPYRRLTHPRRPPGSPLLAPPSTTPRLARSAGSPSAQPAPFSAPFRARYPASCLVRSRAARESTD